MNNPDPNFTTTILVDQTPEEAFAAINNPRGWWSENIEGSTANLGDEWTYRYKDAHRCTMKVIEMAPNKKVVWLVVDNYFNFTQDKTEWKDTKVVFEISTHGNQTEIRFTPLRANIDETVLPVVITEQGENRNQCEEQRNLFGFPHGVALRGT